MGLYAARELSMRDHDVVVIESGGLPLDSFAPESYASVGKPHEGIRLGRARNLGGTSNLWGGQLVEFQPADFEGRAWIPDSQWPVSYDEMSAYHQRTYENLGIPRELHEDKEIWLGVKGSKPDFEEGLELFLTRWLKIPSFSVAYAKEIQMRKNLGVLLNHTVVGFTAESGTITAVEAVDGVGMKRQIEGACFILAAGTIESCRLLLHAASKPGGECPWRHNTNIGAYFQDHLTGRVASVEVLDRHRFFNTFSTIIWTGHKFQPKIRLTNQTLKRSRILNIHAMMSFESSISENLVYLKQFLKAALYSREISGITDLIKNLEACGKHLIPLMWKYVVDNRVFVPSTSKISLNIQSEQTPVRESRISIEPASTDATGLPKVILDWRVGSDDIGSIREFTILCDRALRAAGLAKLDVSSGLVKLEPHFASTLHDNYHHTGGARMATTPNDGVVDCHLKVFGTTNLYVAGAATFRTTSNANTTFTALTFVTRLIDHLTAKAKVR